MNIIIAGADGYLGFMLSERIYSYFHNNSNNKFTILLIFKNESFLSEELLNKDNISICNINNILLQKQILNFSPDIIFCTTCCYETEPENLNRTIDANYVFPARLLQIASLVKVKIVKFISIGTSLPSTLNLYSLTKNHFVGLGIWFHKAGIINFINIALESFYGINEPNDRFISRSILQLKANDDLLLTEGIQKRDFIIIDDVIEILLFLVECKETSILDEFYNTISVGTGIAPSIKEVILFLYNELNSKSILKFGMIEMRRNEPSTIADLSVLRNLGFTKPLLHWKDGMKKVIGSIE
jgi:CDP-paratose synthetase